MKKTGLIVAVVAVAVAGLAVAVMLFGDNLRKLSSGSADALAGRPLEVYRVSPTTTKSLKSFGSGNVYGDADPAPAALPHGMDGNSFERVDPNGWVIAERDARSTFAMDVDTASWTVAKRYLQSGSLPPPAAVRVEEFVNAFSYDYAPPQAPGQLFAAHLEAASSPFNPRRAFVRVGLKARELSEDGRAPLRLVFLVDTSGSMSSSDKLPLAKEALKILLRQLKARDTVALVTYAGGVRDVLPPTSAAEKARITAAIDSLSAGGGTAMGSGMEVAYRHAVEGGVARVIVLSDGDANIGPNLSPEEMLESVRGYVKEGVTLSTVGFGMGNYRDNLMERLADTGNGNASYVGSLADAQRLFGERYLSLVYDVAKDAKVQVAFNPGAVRRYRLVGYENRDVKDEAFRDDREDGGEVGAGHAVTAVYEVELTGEGHTLATVYVRAKESIDGAAREQTFELPRSAVHRLFAEASSDFRFQVAVAAAADILRQAPAAKGWRLSEALELASGASDGHTERQGLVSLLRNVAGRPQATSYAASDDRSGSYSGYDSY